MIKIKPRKLPPLFRWIIWVLFVQFILVNISAAFYAYKLTHFYSDPSLHEPQTEKNILEKTWRLFTGPRQPHSVITQTPAFSIDTLILKTEKGLKIHAWYARPDSAAIGTVLLFHGVTSNKGMMIPEAAEFLFLGYNVVLVDFRAHGYSDGKTTTLGVRESEEVKLAYDRVLEMGEKNIYLWGSSMGAVVIAKAVADYKLEPNGLILEMPFESLKSHLQAKARLLGFAKFTEKPFGFFVTSWMSIERGFNGFRHRTTAYASKINCPVLLQWGALDKYVVRKETDKVFNAIASDKKKLIVYENASHESLLQNDMEKWRDEVERFLSVSN